MYSHALAILHVCGFDGSWSAWESLDLNKLVCAHKCDFKVTDIDNGGGSYR